jgi:hypothetical protein
MRRRVLAAVLMSVEVALLQPSPALAANETAITFIGNGTPLGFGDLEFNVRDAANGTDWSVYSVVNQGSLCGVGGSPCNVNVNNYVGSTAIAAPLTVTSQRQLNTVWHTTDPITGAQWDWIHEVATATWVPGGQPGGGTKGNWYYWWYTYPTAGQSAAIPPCIPAGSPYPSYGWLGYEVVPNDPNHNNPFPPPQTSLPNSTDASHVPGYETRAWVGTSWNYAGDFKTRIDTMTSNWSTGTPSLPPGVSGPNPYVTWTEPSVIYFNGQLVMTMTGMKPAGTDGTQCNVYNGDIWFFTYNFSSSTWSGCKLLDASVAPTFNQLTPGANYKYLTGASIFPDPSTPSNLDLLVSPVNRVAPPGGVPTENYNGELLFGLTGTGGCPQATFASSVMPSAALSETATTFMGAGGIIWPQWDNNATVLIQMHKYCTNPVSVRVGAWVAGPNRNLCS